MSCKSLLSFLFLSVVLYSDISFSHECIVKRLAMDVGSGSLKTGLYEVDVCHDKVVRKIADHIAHLKYEKCLEPNKDKVYLSSDCQKNTKRTLKKIQLRYGVNCGVDAQCAGVATAWARKAFNAPDVLDIYTKNGINIKALSQVEEGELGFYALANHVGKEGDDLNNIAVFDIGGGSFQLSVKVGDKIEVLKGPNGVESYNKYLKGKFNKSDKNHPYYNKNEIELSAEEMAENVKKMLEKRLDIADRLRDPNMKVYAIGRPMSLGMREQMNTGAEITANRLLKKALEFENKTPDEAREIFPKLPEHYIVAAQPSLIIVSGIMKGAGIEKMNIENVKPADYVAIKKDLWN